MTAKERKSIPILTYDMISVVNGMAESTTESPIRRLTENVISQTREVKTLNVPFIFCIFLISCSVIFNIPKVIPNIIPIFAIKVMKPPIPPMAEIPVIITASKDSLVNTLRIASNTFTIPWRLPSAFETLSDENERESNPPMSTFKPFTRREARFSVIILLDRRKPAVNSGALSKSLIRLESPLKSMSMCIPFRLSMTDFLRVLAKAENRFPQIQSEIGFRIRLSFSISLNMPSNPFIDFIFSRISGLIFMEFMLSMPVVISFINSLKLAALKRSKAPILDVSKDESDERASIR